MGDMYYTQDVFIFAPVYKVWDALINPEITPAYMSGCQPVTDWLPGSTLTWRSAKNGVDYGTGKVESFEPEKNLSYTIFNPEAGYVDDPVNYLTTTYSLQTEDNGTRLTVTQGNFANVENGEKRFSETAISWEMTLNAFKRLLED
jgi:uncharacterized protein YndB with AHSA1/START domain